MASDPSFNMKPKEDNYIPALRFQWLTGIFDLVIRFTMPERAFRTALIAQASITSGERILDFGCGTAALSMLAKETHPEAEVTGVDVDDKVLRIAGSKVAGFEQQIELVEYDGTSLPFEDNSFDKVISSLVFHHLTAPQKRNALSEIVRVLKPTGELHIADWGKAANPLMRLLFCLVQLLDGFPNTKDNVTGQLPTMIGEAMNGGVKVTGAFNTIFGTLELFEGKSSNA